MNEAQTKMRIEELQNENASLKADIDKLIAAHSTEVYQLKLQVKATGDRELEQLRRFEKDREERAALVLQNREYLDHIEWAWGVIANAGPEGCLGNWKKLDAEWVKIAENWRDKYHELLGKRTVTEKRSEPVQYCLCQPPTTATIKVHREECYLYAKPG